MLQNNVRLTVATRTISKAVGLLNNHPNGTPVELDMAKEGALDVLEGLVRDGDVDVVVSLLPYVYHVASAKVALKYKKHFCTASYVSDEMMTLDEVAKEAGVIMINECGVDPGLDHMSAQRVIDEVHQKGGKIIDFFSICGGLPAPQDNNNPLGYKLSWSPRGVLLASRNSAVFLEGGEEKKLEGVELYQPGGFRPDFVEGVGDLEWYPNRDSCKYVGIYGVEECKSLIRGTYRYKGWCKMMTKLAAGGFTGLEEVKEYVGMTYAAFTSKVLGLEDGEGGVKERAAKKLGLEVDDDVIHRFEWLGMFSEEKVVGPTGTTALDAVCILFEEKMQYAEGEKDMICMKHSFEVEYPAGRREQITSTLIDFGQQPDGNTSMSRTVALPLAIAVRAVLDKKITLTGIQRPIVPELYNLILDEMEELGVKFVDVHQPLSVHLRHEIKAKEYRSPLSPENAQKLIEAGVKLSVERSSTRCFKDEEFEKVGAKMVEEGSWKNVTPSTVVLGLKELEEDAEVRQNHVYFAHCFKGQEEAEGVLKGFAKRGGELFDLEFLVDERGRRVAAFGHPAGYVGCALGLLHWGLKEKGEEGEKKGLGELSEPWGSSEALIAEVKGKLKGAVPVVHVLGALGRAGKGAVEFAEAVGAKVIKWDIAETKPGGPFPALLDADVVVNCIYLSSPIPPFLTKELVEEGGKNLRVLVDVSCDPNNPHNPLPVYSKITDVFEPVYSIPNSQVDVIAIDHLPSLLPTASSIAFSNDLISHLLDLVSKDEGRYGVWKRAYELFVEKKAPYC